MLPKVVPPGECHPAYLNMPWLRNWVDGRGPITGQTVRIPLMLRHSVVFAEPEEPFVEPDRELIMTRHKAAGPAPYVGDPFVYVWWIGVDSVGRQIASDSRIVYTGGPRAA